MADTAELYIKAQTEAQTSGLPTPERPAGDGAIASGFDPFAGVVDEASEAGREIYFISGLGADWRVFHRLQLKGYRPVHICWERPYRGESIEHYAQRLLGQVTTPHPILVGLSFGGLMAVEMAKLCDPAQVIVISSAVSGAQVPNYYKLFRWLPLQLIVPFKQLLWAVYGVISWLFGLEDPEDRSLFKQVLIDTDPFFLRWAMNRVVGWRNQVVPKNVVQIHGGRDRVFPFGHHSADIVVPDGGHLMVLNRAEQLSRLLMATLATNPVES
ncbi:alpha/beta hydrolase [Nodosilinea sp. LEGE 07298]|uniref:alpha/beta hydrolase n=1 Tax=Nodosilinea sp. LEGE 07298 TaxID=2777970 RepID=UPI001883072F|nr:alpha/beta hydrolase [Nodosilinea sp. LEGE 07298]MBE9111351.1 alpha/beta hydrolase [Nodosilinea sp. LEGE 07298]